MEVTGSMKITYSEKLSREKTFANFEVLGLFAKVFSAKFGGVASFGGTKSFLHENLFFYQVTKVKFLLFGKI